MKKTTLITIATLLHATAASAYIDPGTAGATASLLTTILTAAAATIAATWIFLKTNAKKYAAPLFNTPAKRTAAAIIATTIAATAALLALTQTDQKGLQGDTMDQPRKLIVIGIDGFDPDIVDYLMAKGKMPNFKKLAVQGTYTRMATMDPPISPVVWTTIATGMDPDHHNIFEFMRFDKKQMLPYLSIIEQSNTITGTKYTPPIKAETFWQTASSAGLRTSIIRWPLTFPATKTNGNILSGFGTPDIQGYLNSYALYTEQQEENQGSPAMPITIDQAGTKRAVLYGPPKPNGKPTEVEVKITPITDTAVNITINGNSYTLNKDTWSPWIKINYSTPLTGTTSAQTRAYLTRVKPTIEIFFTSPQTDPLHPSIPISYPPQYAAQIAKATSGSYYTIGMPEDIKAVNDGNLPIQAFTTQINDIHQERQSMLKSEIKKLAANQISLLAIVFEETDRAQHILYASQVHRNGALVTNVATDIERLYTQKDNMIGDVFEAIPPATALIVISDHGFKPFTKTINLNTWLSQNGYLAMNPTAKGAESRPLYKDVDWPNTKAYSYGYTAININLKGRERYGSVSNGEKSAIIKEIMQKISNEKDPRTGARIIDTVIDATSKLPGPQSANAPDIVVLPAPPYRTDWQSPLGQTTKDFVSTNTKPWQADHMFASKYVPAVFLSNFKIKRPPTVWDIAPTVANIMGLTKHPQYKGTSLLEEKTTKKQ